MVHYQIQIDANLVHTCYAYILKHVLQLCLIDHFLHGVQVEVEDLVLLDDKTPKVEDLIHRVLLKASQTCGLLKDCVEALMELLALVRVGKELRDLKATPDHRNIFGSFLFLLPL